MEKDITNKLENTEGVVSNISSEAIAFPPTSMAISKNDSQEGEVSTKEDIDWLNDLLVPVLNTFKDEKEQIENKISIFMWIAIGLSMFLFISYILIIIGKDWILPDFNPFYQLKTWYEIGIRITFVSLLISIIVYSLKMLKIYLALLEQIRHKIAVIKGMPTLICASEDDALFKSSYIKIIDMIVQLSNWDSLSKEENVFIATNIAQLTKLLNNGGNPTL